MSTYPATMSAVEISEFGGPEVLKLVERPTPEPGQGEVLIKVAAAGVNRGDCVQRIGFYPAPPGASDLPGLEVSGTVDAVGPEVDGIAVGDEVVSDAAGLAITNPGVGGEVVAAKALDSAGGAGEFIEVLLVQ